MSIDAELTEALKEGMRSKDAARVSCIRQVKAKMQETVNAKGFKGEINDELWVKVIGSYVKMLTKGIEELEAAGSRGDDLKTKYAAEVAYLQKYLPKLMGEAETRTLVTTTITDLGVSDPKMIGKVIGAIMKEHKGEVDAGLVRKIADETLNPPEPKPQ